MTSNDIKFIKSLSKREIRNEHSLFVGEGEKLVRELLRNGLKISKIYTTKENLTLPDCSVEQISAGQMERISQLKSAPEVLALVEIPKFKRDYKGGLALALDGVQDPGNLGTIIRVAGWYGVKQIFCSKDSVDCFSNKVVQSTMGAICGIEVVYVDLCQFLSELKDVSIYGTFLERSTAINSLGAISTNSILVMGNEGQGISSSVESLISERIFLPPYGTPIGVESLNVAVATAITLSHFRQL